MREQFNHLIEAADLPSVTRQVLPFAAGAHAGMDGTFTILLYSEFEGKNHDEAKGKNQVFVSNAAGGLFLEKDGELERYALSSIICGQVPWPPPRRFR
jgi:Domain of unknown function (DUF5753)